ncbi:hypothetical protein GO009_15515 [Muricauda sp. TY007]|nr:hypothetical protein [Muricauda sp. TY007]
MDCGPTCLRMVAKHFGKEISLDKLRSESYITREGVSLMGISHAAESIGLKSLGTRIDLWSCYLYSDIKFKTVCHKKIS